MSYTVTPLGLQLPVPGSGQAFSTAVYNSNLTKLDTAIGALQQAAGTPTSGTIASASGFTRQGDTYLNKTADGYVEGFIDFNGTFPNVVARVIGTLPAGFRPTTTKTFPFAFSGNDIPGAGTITANPDGTLQVITAGGSHLTASGYIRFKLGN